MERWTAEEARKALQHWKQSGQSAEAYARAQGFSPQRLWWWKKRLGTSPREREGGAVPTLVPMRVRIPEPPVHVEHAVSIRVRGGLSVEIDASRVSPAWVAELVTELASK
jgi:transposase-like protein